MTKAPQVDPKASQGAATGLDGLLLRAATGFRAIDLGWDPSPMESRHFAACLGWPRGEKADRVVDELNSCSHWPRWVPVSVWSERRRGTSNVYVFVRIGGRKRYLGQGVDLKEAFEKWLETERKRFAQCFAGFDRDSNLDIQFEFAYDAYAQRRILQRIRHLLRARGIRPHRVLRCISNPDHLLKAAVAAKTMQREGGFQGA